MFAISSTSLLIWPEVALISSVAEAICWTISGGVDIAHYLSERDTDPPSISRVATISVATAITPTALATSSWMLAYHRAYLRRGVNGPLRELPHLVGDNSEAPALLSGPGRLYGRVESQEVRLIGDLVYDAYYFTDLFRALSQRFHEPGRFVNRTGDLPTS